MNGVCWGDVGRPFTPAFWRYYCIATDAISDKRGYRLGQSLREEVAACLLGGHGISGELGVAAYRHLKREGLLNASGVKQARLEEALRIPLNVNGRTVHYRFPSQKARYLAGCLHFLDNNDPPGDSSLAVRNWLTKLPGVGLKTASWVVRNLLDANDVAILDIHIHRAGVLVGLFGPNENVTTDYESMEQRFVDFSNRIGIPASTLDNQVWNELRVAPSVVRKFLIEHGVKNTDKCGLPSGRGSSIQRNLNFCSTEPALSEQKIA